MPVKFYEFIILFSDTISKLVLLGKDPLRSIDRFWFVFLER